MSAQLIPCQRLTKAKEAFFTDGEVPTGVIDEAIVASWKRCMAQDKSVTDNIVYEILPGREADELANKNQALTMASKAPMEYLHRAVSSAGYALLLTDRYGHALNTYIGSPVASSIIQRAFRPGIDLSERSIGTSAMSCALSAGRPVIVSGPEHYFNANQSLSCAAAPIIAPSGHTIGSIDITREHYQTPGSALSLATQCARAIESRLITQLAPYLVLQLSWQQGTPTGDMLIALGREGEMLGMTPQVREILGLKAADTPPTYEALFDQSFGDLVDAARQQRTPVPGQLASGLTFALHPHLCQQASFIEGKAVLKEDKQPSRPTIPYFGDTTLNERAALAIKAITRGLPVLIQGETGVGKEVLAKALHEQSDKKAGRFVAINCAAIPETLIESELFGHADGAYTGARRGGAPGKIEQADGGTLFLDEIGDMPLALQSRLLRVLETQEIHRLGANGVKQVSFRLICATHHDLGSAVAQGAFRGDLFYRIKGMPLWIPPLRERTELQAFLVAQCDQMTHSRRQLSHQALMWLVNYAWPGNARELRHALTYADLLADDDERFIELSHFPSDITSTDTQRINGCEGKALESLKAQERHAITAALEQASGNVSQAAKHLGIGRATLYRKLKEMRGE